MGGEYRGKAFIPRKKNQICHRAETDPYRQYQANVQFHSHLCESCDQNTNIPAQHDISFVCKKYIYNVIGTIPRVLQRGHGILLPRFEGYE